MEKLYKIYYGDGENEYIVRNLKEEEIIGGYLSESKAFELFYGSMIICNDYLKFNYENIEYLVESDDDEFQTFIIETEFDNDITMMATEKMENNLYYDNKLDLYLVGVTDIGTSRAYVATDLKVEEMK